MTVHSGQPPRRGLSDRTFGFLLTLPALALLGAVVLYPLAGALSTSLFRQSLVLPGRSFVGLDNFRSVLDQNFWPVLQNTVVFTVGSTLVPVVIGFALALALNTPLRGRAVLRGLFLFPWVIPGVVVSFVWLWIFNANYGLLNGILTRLGVVDEPISWFSEPGTAMAAIIVAKSWASFPWIMVMLLAGLQTVPPTLHEAAALDGAGALARFWHVTLPHLRGILGIVVLLEVIWNVQHFDMIYVLTGGGPAGSTTTFAVAVYDSAFKAFDLGKASALGALWLVLILALVVVYVRLTERGERA
ncbi:carbohydrate ABC transporter permease [Dactylosporangium matsuzakiense]|uniref:Sugar ABC transporter permease n=1 Tax=Dactylosporangium matsuzakiense TaxID=53360 RepID=A0A9W6KNV5_9ACTN|nr:sugar ABC transporter permease [Dactylosporangium matsuzakiense]UWZ48356.1 sugar ABC transporter permease [Dactylosporangium matsuzakiense]GLL05491.1 sugar ABC transporter permease [Dactylosporangium matsuzakiense]